VLGLLAVAAGPLLVRGTFTDLGHTTAVLLGLALAVLVSRAATRAARGNPSAR
jgi:hypothetical protein